jgi:CheY-like chemotaxis protein
MWDVEVTERPGAAMTLADEARTGLSVLVVEDDADAAHTYAVLLGIFGHRVRIAADGPAAVRLAAESAPDVALIDIGLPGMDGCAVAERLRGASADRRPLLVAITGYGEAEFRRRSDEAGIDLHLKKPVDPEKLLRLLRRFERSSAARKRPSVRRPARIRKTSR